MTNSPCHRQASPAFDQGQARHLLGVARRLFAQRGPGVTLTEIAMEAIADRGESRCSEVVEVLLGQRLGDLVDIARALPEPQRHRVPRPRVIWAETVREIVLEHLDRPDLSLRGVARILAVSPRTLQRRLADERTSWRAILDTARRERVIALLHEGATADVTAALVGYAGSRPLRRARRRWRVDSQPAADRG